MYNSVAFSTSSILCNCHLYFQNVFIIPKRNSVSTEQSFLHSSLFSATKTNLLSVSTYSGCFIQMESNNMPLVVFCFLNLLPWCLRWESICLQWRRPTFNPWVVKITWRRKWQPTPVLLPGKSHGWRKLIGYSP